MSAVVLTGLGVVSPFGVGAKAFWDGLAGGACAIRPVTLIDAEGFRCRLAAEVPDPLPGSRRRSRAERPEQGFAHALRLALEREHELVRTQGVQLHRQVTRLGANAARRTALTLCHRALHAGNPEIIASRDAAHL